MNYSETCPHTGKFIHTKAGALRHVVHLKTSTGRVTHAYRCPACGGWHAGAPPGSTEGASPTWLKRPPHRRRRPWRRKGKVHLFLGRPFP